MANATGNSDAATGNAVRLHTNLKDVSEQMKIKSYPFACWGVNLKQHAELMHPTSPGKYLRVDDDLKKSLTKDKPTAAKSNSEQFVKDRVCFPTTSRQIVLEYYVDLQPLSQVEKPSDLWFAAFQPSFLGL